MKKGDFILNLIRVPLDLAMLVLAGIATYRLRTDILDAYRPVMFALDLPLARFIGLVLAVAALFMIVYAVAGLYAMKLRMTKGQEVTRIILASSAAILAVVLTIFLRQELFNSRFLVVGYWALATFCVVVGRMLLRIVQRRLMSRYSIGIHRILLIGNDEVTGRLEQTMSADPGLGWRIVKRLGDPDISEVGLAVSNPGVDEVILASPDYPAQKIVQLVDFCHEHHIVFKFVPNIYQTLTTHYDVDAIGRIPVVELQRTSLDGWGRVFKRSFDAVAAVCALIVLSPLLALIAFAIKWETAGPVLVRLKRISRNRHFMLYKFRSMIENAEELKPLLDTRNERADGPLFKMRDDPRITGVGKVLRKYRLDEIPQFLNVFFGHISLVGPRPHQPDEIAKYARHHKKVLAIKAGATGLAQVSGSSDLRFEEEVALDTFYIENWSFMLDVRIIFRTVLKMFIDHSAV
jgi:exopolysaccharide biosynthesis polyprenyl glycosylphosphotransferase